MFIIMQHSFFLPLNKILNDKTRFTHLQEKYFNSDRALQNAVSVLKIPDDQLPSSTAGKPEAKAYYYFFFTRPMMDAGSSQNRVIKHTGVLQITCMPEEL